MPRRRDGDGGGLAAQALKNQADALQAELDLMKKRLSDLETVVTPE
jgi:hypothetical protein